MSTPHRHQVFLDHDAPRADRSLPGPLGPGSAVTDFAALATSEDSSESALPQVLRLTMRRHAAGVSVVTTCDAGGGPVGFCATSLTSVSLQPPTVSFSVGVNSTSGRAWRNTTHGIIHLLRSDQADVASAFAISGPGKFAGPVDWRWGPAGQPLLDNVLGWMLVRTRIRMIVGDHLLIVCDVREATVQSGHGPLIHYDSGFYSLP